MKKVVIKLDMEKTFDKVDWTFLKNILVAKGFGSKWRRWIQRMHLIHKLLHHHQRKTEREALCHMRSPTRRSTIPFHHGNGLPQSRTEKKQNTKGR